MNPQSTGATLDRSNPAALLRGALIANAMFSTISAVAMLAAPGPIADALGIAPAQILSAVGIGLLAFAVALARNARQSTPEIAEARLAVALDAAWVVGSVVLIAAGAFTTSGNWIVALVADVVLVFAVLQTLGIRRLERG